MTRLEMRRDLSDSLEPNMRASKVVPERAAPKTITGLSKIELPHLGTVYLKHSHGEKVLKRPPA
jgi:hypothetical protein